MALGAVSAGTVYGVTGDMVATLVVLAADAVLAVLARRRAKR